MTDEETNEVDAEVLQFYGKSGNYSTKQNTIKCMVAKNTWAYYVYSGTEYTFWA